LAKRKIWTGAHGNRRPTSHKSKRRRRKAEESGRVDKSKRANSDEARAEYVSLANTPGGQAIQDWIGLGDYGRRVFYLKHRLDIDRAIRDKRDRTRDGAMVARHRGY